MRPAIELNSRIMEQTMRSTHVSAFETTIAKTNSWLGELEASMNWADLSKSYMALRRVARVMAAATGCDRGGETLPGSLRWPLGG